MSGTRAVLIIGGSGFVGTQLALELREGYKVFATYLTHPMRIPGVTSLPFNVEDRNWVKRVVYIVRPDFVVYCAGSNNAIWCEENPKEAEKVHTSGAATVSNTADIFQPKFIYLSSSYAFDGNRGNYKESDIVLAGTALGKAKIGGENLSRTKLNYVVVRSSPLFGRGNGKNLTFLDNLRMHLDRGQRIELPSDELHSFAPVSGLVDMVSDIIHSGIRNKTLHYGGLTKITYFEFGKLFAKRFGYNPDLVIESRRPQIKGYAPSLWDYSLNSSQAVETLRIKPLSIEDGLEQMHKKFVPSKTG